MVVVTMPNQTKRVNAYQGLLAARDATKERCVAARYNVTGMKLLFRLPAREALQPVL
jgi:hypothetical protein